jgi:hypothetical protein
MRAWMLTSCLLAGCSPQASREVPQAPAPIVAPAPEPAAPPDAPAAPAKVSISDFASYGNCMPTIIGPNSAARSPHITAWNLDIEGATSAAVESAVLIVGAETPMRFDLELEEPAIVLQNGAMHTQQRVKVYRNGPSFGACGEMCSSAAPTKLELTLRIDGASRLLTAEGEYSCAH